MHPVERHARSLGDVFSAFREQDSGCLSFGVQTDTETLFVKGSTTPRTYASLQRSERIFKTVQHRALPAYHNERSGPVGDVYVLVFDWVNAAALYDPVRFRGHANRHRPDGPYARFYALPLEKRLDAIQTVYALHTCLAEHGIIAVDLYDGSLLYDFDTDRMWVCDLDEYRPDGPFRLMTDRLFGSSRFMAPEESQRGATIDQRTNVFTLGRLAFELLSYGSTHPKDWPASRTLHTIARSAISPRRTERPETVAAYTHAWMRACS